MPKFCQSCGAQAAEESRFCGSCGRAFDAALAADVSSPVATESSPTVHPNADEIVWTGSPDAILAPLAARTTNYVITRSRLTVDKGLLGKKNDSLELFRVKDISVKKSLAQRARGVGDVIITSTDASTPTMILEAVSQPDVVASDLRRLTQEARAKSNIYLREGL